MGLLDNRVSQDDIERVSDVRHHPEFETGFDGSGGDDSLGDFDDFGNLDDLFGGSDDSSGGFGDSGFGSSSGFGDSGFGSSGGFGSNSNSGFGNSGGSSGGFGQGGFGDSGFGSSGGFGQGGFGQGGFGQGGFGQGGFGQGGFGQNGMNQNGQQAVQKDTMDKMLDAGAAAAEGLGAIIVEMFKSFKERNADDFGYLSSNLIKIGFVAIPVGVLMCIAGSIGDINAIVVNGSQISLSGGLSLATGIIGLGTAALVLTKKGEQEIGSIEDIANEPPGEDNFTLDVEDNAGDVLDDLFGDDFDNLFNDDNDENVQLSLFDMEGDIDE